MLWLETWKTFSNQGFVTESEQSIFPISTQCSESFSIVSVDVILTRSWVQKNKKIYIYIFHMLQLHARRLCTLLALSALWKCALDSWSSVYWRHCVRFSKAQCCFSFPPAGGVVEQQLRAEHNRMLCVYWRNENNVVCSVYCVVVLRVEWPFSVYVYI